MTTSEEKVDTSTEYMTEYEKWAVSGVKRAEELIEESNRRKLSERIQQMNRECVLRSDGMLIQ